MTIWLMEESQDGAEWCAGRLSFSSKAEADRCCRSTFLRDKREGRTPKQYRPKEFKSL